MKNILILFLIAGIAAGCNEDDNVSSTEELTLDLQGLPNLGTDATYEGWIIVDGSPISTGTFDVDDNGDASKSSFMLDRNELQNATQFVLTIEPVPDADPAPSDVHILGGDFNNESAALTISHPTALGTSFTSATGGYILATPTTTTDEDSLSGVWFLENPQTPSLNIPDLTNLSGWTYEGWAVIDGTPVSTGTFNKASGADDSSMFSGSEASGPAYPGEDFIMNAPSGLAFPTNLEGATIVVSIEPVPDNDPAPFVLKPLAGEVPMSARAMTVYELNNIAASTYPSGSAKR